MNENHTEEYHRCIHSSSFSLSLACFLSHDSILTLFYFPNWLWTLLTRMYIFNIWFTGLVVWINSKQFPFFGYPQKCKPPEGLAECVVFYTYMFGYFPFCQVMCQLQYSQVSFYSTHEWAEIQATRKKGRASQVRVISRLHYFHTTLIQSLTHAMEQLNLVDDSSAKNHIGFHWIFNSASYFPCLCILRWINWSSYSCRVFTNYKCFTKITFISLQSNALLEIPIFTEWAFAFLHKRFYLLVFISCWWTFVHKIRRIEKGNLRNHWVVYIFLLPILWSSLQAKFLFKVVSNISSVGSLDAWEASWVKNSQRIDQWNTLFHCHLPRGIVAVGAIEDDVSLGKHPPLVKSQPNKILKSKQNVW